MHVLVAVLERVRRVGERDEVGRDQLRALMDELVERVLAVGAGLAPEDLTGLGGDGRAVPTHGLAVGLHGELLQVRREAVQVLVVRQHGVRGDLEEVAVPDVEHAHEHHDVLVERGVGEVFIDLVETVEELLEARRSEDDGEREADGGIDGVAAADPIPEAERVGRVNAELLDALKVRGHGHEVLFDGFGLGDLGAVDRVARGELLEEPCARLTGVGQGLEGAEGLGDDDEQRGLRVQVAGLLGDVVGVDVGNVAGLDAGVGERLERLVRHDGTQVGATDADVDDGFDLLAGHALPFAGTDLLRERVHALEGLAHILDGVLSVHDVLAFVFGRAAQRGVQHGAVLGVVDVHAGVHLLGALGEVDLVGEFGEELQRLRLDQVLGKIEVQRARFEREVVHAVLVVREPLLEVDALGLHLVVVALQLGPCLGLSGVNWRIDSHIWSFHHHQVESAAAAAVSTHVPHTFATLHRKSTLLMKCDSAAARRTPAQRVLHAAENRGAYSRFSCPESARCLTIALTSWLRARGAISRASGVSTTTMSFTPSNAMVRPEFGTTTSPAESRYATSSTLPSTLMLRSFTLGSSAATELKSPTSSQPKSPGIIATPPSTESGSATA